MTRKADNVSNLKPKDNNRGEPTCSFCGTHKDDVPLVVQSNVTKAKICNFCALTIVNQTMSITQDIANANVELRQERYALAEKLEALQPTKEPEIIMPTDRKQSAIDAANAAEVDDDG